MKEIIDYEMVGSSDLQSFNHRIKRLTSEGFEPYEKPLILLSGSYTVNFYQAMVKYKRNEYL